MNRYRETSVDQGSSGDTEDLPIPKRFPILAWIIILISVAGIGSFSYVDFRNRNFPCYPPMIGNYASYSTPFLLTGFVALLWRGHGNGLPILKTLWLQAAALFLTLSIGMALYGP